MEDAKTSKGMKNSPMPMKAMKGIKARQVPAKPKSTKVPVTTKKTVTATNKNM